MKQSELFPDPLLPFQGGVPAGERLKQEGQGRAAAKRADDLRHARLVARCIAENRGTVTADDVADALEKSGRAPLGNAAGVIFQTDEFEWTGERRKSKRPKQHAHERKVWRLKGT